MFFIAPDSKVGASTVNGGCIRRSITAAEGGSRIAGGPAPEDGSGIEGSLCPLGEDGL